MGEKNQSQHLKTPANDITTPTAGDALELCFPPQLLSHDYVPFMDIISTCHNYKVMKLEVCFQSQGLNIL